MSLLEKIALIEADLKTLKVSIKATFEAVASVGALGIVTQCLSSTKEGRDALVLGGFPVPPPPGFSRLTTDPPILLTDQISSPAKEASPPPPENERENESGGDSDSMEIEAASSSASSSATPSSSSSSSEEEFKTVVGEASRKRLLKKRRQEEATGQGLELSPPLSKRKTRRVKSASASPTQAPQASPAQAPQASPTQAPQANPTQASQASPTTAPQATPTQRKGKVPPLVLREKNKWDHISHAMTERGIRFTSAASTSEGIRITVPTSEDHRRLTRLLDGEGVGYHSFTLQEDKLLRVVIRGIPAEVDTSRVLEDLKSQGYPILEVHRMSSGRTRTPYEMVLAILTMDGKAIYALKSLVGLTKISVEKPRKGNAPSQCHRCQMYGHSARCCRARPRCVKCLGDHGTKECERPKDRSLQVSPPSCVLCGEQGHPANYRGCPKAPRTNRGRAGHRATGPSRPKPTPSVPLTQPQTPPSVPLTQPQTHFSVPPTQPHTQNGPRPLLVRPPRQPYSKVVAKPLHTQYGPSGPQTLPQSAPHMAAPANRLTQVTDLLRLLAGARTQADYLSICMSHSMLIAGVRVPDINSLPPH